MNNKKIKKTIFIIILVIIISLIIFTIYSIANSNKEKKSEFGIESKYNK